MWTISLLLCCCLWAADAQSDGSRRKNIWNEPITFQTKAKDLCSMIITGQGELTKLRVSCQGSRRRSYWCEYVGKPHTCRPYNKNPRHYFVQMMWGLRKLHNACQAPPRIQTHMCRKATDDSQMVFSSASFPRPWSEPTSRPGSRPGSGPGPAAPTRPGPGRQGSTQAVGVPARPRSTQRSSVTATTPARESDSRRLARRYCWRSLQGFCAFFIRMFRN